MSHPDLAALANCNCEPILLPEQTVSPWQTMTALPSTRLSSRSVWMALFLIPLFALASQGKAQTMGGVFSPIVKQGHASAQYRFGINPDGPGGEDQIAHYLHYQKSLNDSFMLRGIAQVRDTGPGTTDFDFVEGQLFWQLSENGSSWQRGFRFDARLRDGGRPTRLGASWTNQLQLTKRTQARFILMGAVEAGANTPDGVFLQTRARLSRRFDDGPTVGVDMFNNYGSSDDFGGFDDQSHQIGPFISVPVTEHWSLLGSTLIGVSDSAPDTNVRIWLTRMLN